MDPSCLFCLFPCSIVITARKGLQLLTSWLSCVLSFLVFLSLFHMVSPAGVILDYIDS